MKLCTCLANSREEHMIMQPDESDDDEQEEDEDTSGSEEDSDSGSEHDSGDANGAAANGGDEANDLDAEGAGSHGGDDTHTHKDRKKVSRGAGQQRFAAVYVVCQTHTIPPPVHGCTGRS